MIINIINSIATLNQHSSVFLGIGIVIVITINLWKWQGDIAHARQFAKGFKQFVSIKSKEKVSVLVAAWNEAEHIKNHIESFLNLHYPQKELILCAGGEDDTLAIAKSYTAKNVIVLEQKGGEGKQQALRRCFARAKGSVIFLTDADCFLDDENFERTISPVLMKKEKVTTGISLPTERAMKNVFISSQATPQLYVAMHAEHYVNGIFGRNCAIRSYVLNNTRALEKEAPSGTDYVLAKTLLNNNIKIYHVPHSLMQSEYHKCIPKYIHQQWRWAKNVFFYGKQFGARKEVSHIFFNALVGLIMLLLPVSFLFGLNLISIIWIMFFLHALVSRLRYIDTVGKAYDLLMPKGIKFFQPLMLIIDFFAWARPLPDFILKTRKVRW